MIVYKFGGTSVADAERIRHAAGLVCDCEGERVVVVSALAGVTNQLVELAFDAVMGNRAGVERLLEDVRARHEAVGSVLLRALSDRDRLMERVEAVLTGLAEAAERGLAASDPESVRRLTDELSAVGEDLSAEMMAAALMQEGLAARAVDARGMVRTDGRFGGAVPRDEDTARLVREVLRPLLAQGHVPVLQGFVGATEEGATTTLGRGGSDFTAAIIGAALEADEVCIWTDVDGVMSAEPQHVEHATVLPELGYEEAVELAYFGARVIHPAAAKHAVAGDVSLVVRNAQRPDRPGTRIRPDTRRASGVAAVAYKPAVTLIKVRSRPMFMAYGFLARVFEVLARHRLPVDLVATSHTSTAFTLDGDEGLGGVREDLGRFAEVEVLPHLATVSVVGHGLLQEPGITARVFSALGQTSVQLISQASDVSLSFLVEAIEAPDVVRRLHAELIESRVKGDT